MYLPVTQSFYRRFSTFSARNVAVFTAAIVLKMGGGIYRHFSTFP